MCFVVENSVQVGLPKKKAVHTSKWYIKWVPSALPLRPLLAINADIFIITLPLSVSVPTESDCLI